MKQRAVEALGLCSKRAVRDCRVAEIRQSLLNSQRLQEDYFVTHENDLLALRHDAKLKVYRKISSKNQIMLFLENYFYNFQ